MCRVETRRRHYTDGTSEIVTLQYPCRNASDRALCSRVQYYTERGLESIRAIRMSPERSSSDGAIEGFNGRERDYRIVTSRRIGTRGRSRNQGSPSPSSIYSPGSAHSAPAIIQEVPPRAPTPPTPPGGTFRPPGSLRRSFEENVRIVAPSGTAIYPLPSSSLSPRPRFAGVRPDPESPSSSTVAEVTEVTPMRRGSQRTKVPKRVDTSRRSTGSSSPAISSPGLGQLPRVGESSKHDSARESPVLDEDASQYRPRPEHRFSHPSGWPRNNHDRASEVNKDRSSAQRSNEPAAGDETLERHRQRAMQALESQENDRNIQADLIQMERERRRQSGSEGAVSQPPRSPRGDSLTLRPRYTVQVHQTSSGASRNILEQSGDRIIEREQNRGEPRASDPAQDATRRLDDAIRGGASQRRDGRMTTQKRRSHRKDHDERLEGGGQERWI